MIPYHVGMVDPVVLVVYALAVARVTGLITLDTLTEPARDALLGWLDNRPKTAGSLLATLITCPWCAGFWVAALAAPLVWLWGSHPILLVPALAMAFSQVAGMVASVGRE